MSLDAYNQVGPECPKCGHVITADEPHYYSEDDYTEDTCPKCNAKFEVTLDRTVAWSTTIEDADEGDGPATADGPANSDEVKP